jgi:hypothetical protein
MSPGRNYQRAGATRSLRVIDRQVREESDSNHDRPGSPPPESVLKQWSHFPLRLAPDNLLHNSNSNVPSFGFFLRGLTDETLSSPTSFLRSIFHTHSMIGPSRTAGRKPSKRRGTRTIGERWRERRANADRSSNVLVLVSIFDGSQPSAP